jgi:hypothetical protein
MSGLQFGMRNRGLAARQTYRDAALEAGALSRQAPSLQGNSMPSMQMSRDRGQAMARSQTVLAHQMRMQEQGQRDAQLRDWARLAMTGDRDAFDREIGQRRLSLAEQGQAFDQGMGERRMQLGEQGQAFDQGMDTARFGLSRDQFEHGKGMDEKRFGLSRDQFEHGKGMDEKRFGLDERRDRWNRAHQDWQEGFAEDQFEHGKGMDEKRFGLSRDQFEHGKGMDEKRFGLDERRVQDNRVVRGAGMTERYTPDSVAGAFDSGDVRGLERRPKEASERVPDDPGRFWTVYARELAGMGYDVQNMNEDELRGPSADLKEFRNALGYLQERGELTGDTTQDAMQAARLAGLHAPGGGEGEGEGALSKRRGGGGRAAQAARALTYGTPGGLVARGGQWALEHDPQLKAVRGLLGTQGAATGGGDAIVGRFNVDGVTYVRLADGTVAIED